MAVAVTLYDANTLDEIVWPEDADAQRLRRYLVPMVKEGPQHFIDNADVDMLALKVDDQVLPVVLGREKPGNTCVCSPYSHYIAYAGDELGKLRGGVLGKALRGGLSLMGGIARRCRIDRVVYVNNWLWITNPVVRLSVAQVAAVTDRLRSTYPDRAIVFRNVDRPTRPGLRDALLACGYGLPASRKIYLFDGTSPASAKHHDIDNDLRLLRKTPYELIGGEHVTEGDVPRLAELYRLLYLEKYNPLNPQFNERFFRLLVLGGVAELTALRRDGRIDAFAMVCQKEGVLTPPAIGYDTGLPRRLGLYRMAVMTLIRDALTRGAVLNLSAGVGRFKMLRGAVPTVECDAVYDRHLDPHRRLPWMLLRAAFNRATVNALHE